MSAYKKCAYALFSMALAVGCLLAVFAVMDASSARAGGGEIPPPAPDLVPTIVVTPTELQATLYPNAQLTQTLWITNNGDSPLTYTIYELSAPLRLAGFTTLPVSAPIIDPEAQSQVTAQGHALVLIYLREQPDLSPAYAIPDHEARVQYVYDRLLETASHSQGLYDWLASQGTAPRRLLTANAIAATLDASQLTTVAGNPQVRYIGANRQYNIIPDIPTSLVGPQVPTVSSARPETVEWNIAKIRADLAWSTFGITGTGVVVGSIDTGVMYNHLALVNSYRGNLGGGNFDHNYSWVDFVNHQMVPYDDNGNGTMGIGIVSGDDGGVNQIGVVPGADWIAAKVCMGGGSCGDVEIHSGFQWMLAPTDLSGNNPDPSKAPDIVLGMWGGGSCDSWLQPDLAVLRAAGILPVFPPGRSGPACASMGSPADLPEALAAGATDQSDVIASFSARGPSCYDEIKPDVVAPGVDIRTSWNDGGYMSFAGSTSFASLHAAGTAALIISADPSLGPDGVEDILYTTALCIDDSSCYGGPCPLPNNVYGHGRIDAFEAVSYTLSILAPFDLPWLGETPISGTLDAGMGVAIQVTFDTAGLATGVYTGALGIASSDPITPLVSVPVTLNVLPTPHIVIAPQSFSAILPVGGIQTDTLTISNDGDATLSFTLYETSTHGLMAPLLSVPGSPANPYPSGTPIQVEALARTQVLFLGRARLIIYLRLQPDLSGAYAFPSQAQRAQFVYDRLLETAALSDDLYNWLVSQGAEPHRLLTANAIAATLDAAQLEAVAARPEVGRIGINGYAHAITDGGGAMANVPAPLTVEWNIARIRADEAWSVFGVTGARAVVGEIDTGVMYTHPALISQYRGNLGGGNYDHNYNWYDFINNMPAPYDDHSHGTFGMGVAVGDDGLGNQIGVAPGAQWMAVKALDAGGGGTLEDLHAALQWMLAPTDLTGANPDPSKAPDVVLNMWGISSYYCDHYFDLNLTVLRAANILPVFAPGGEGPGCGTVATPAADPNALSAGATDNSDTIAPFSANGPSCYDGSIKPDLAAPGAEIRSSTNDGSYQVWSGTSFSTAHLAGAAALLFSANPDISLDTLEQNLFDTAVCHEPAYCGGDACPGANNTYGYGRIDVFEAVSLTLGTRYYDLPWLIAGPVTGVMPPGGSMNIPITFDASTVQPGIYTGGIGIESNDPLLPFTVLPVTLTVYAPCQPIADLSAGFTPFTPTVGEVVTFTASATGTLPISYTWWFVDDDVIATGPVVTHVFTTPNYFYQVVLTAENACDIQHRMLFVLVGGPYRYHLPIISR